MLVFNFLVTTNMFASFKILKSSMSSVLMVWTVTKWSRRASLVSKRTSLQNLHFRPKINYFQKNRREIFIWWKLNILKKLVKLPFPLCLPILWIRQDSFLMKTVSQSKHEYDFLNLGLVIPDKFPPSGWLADIESLPALFFFFFFLLLIVCLRSFSRKLFSSALLPLISSASASAEALAKWVKVCFCSNSWLENTSGPPTQPHLTIVSCTIPEPETECSKLDATEPLPEWCLKLSDDWELSASLIWSKSSSTTMGCTVLGSMLWFVLKKTSWNQNIHMKISNFKKNRQITLCVC